MSDYNRGRDYNAGDIVEQVPSDSGSSERGEEEDDDDEMLEDEDDEEVLGPQQVKILIDEFDKASRFDASEAQQVKTFLHTQGREAFYQRYVFGDGIELRKLLRILNTIGDDEQEKHTHMSIKRLSLIPIDLYPQVLDALVTEELSTRRRLSQYESMDDLLRLILKSNNITVITGAGISTSLGIPDFRSDSGLYTKLSKMGISEPQEIFDINLFRQDPKIFYHFAKEILPPIPKVGEANIRVSPTHSFIKILQDKGKLLTNYTQNVDGLENKAGILPDKIVQCHGSFATATCQRCFHQVIGDEIIDDIRKGEVAYCKQPCCNKKKRRSSDDEDDEDEEEEGGGVMKPDIIFFGEALPDTFDKRVINVDRNQCDLLICIGTSLKVAPVSEIVKVIKKDIVQIFISKTPPIRKLIFDFTLLGACDEISNYLCRQLSNLTGDESWYEELCENPQVLSPYIKVPQEYGDGIFVFDDDVDLIAPHSSDDDDESSDSDI